MSKSLSLILLAKRHKFIYPYRLSRCILFQERNLSSKDNSDDDQNSKLKDDLSDKETRSQTSLKSPESKKKIEAASKEEVKEAAKKKLFSLLSEMKVTSEDKPKSNLNLARAMKRPSKEERFKEEIQRRAQEKLEKSPDEQLQKAAIAVASSISKQPDKTLSELNEKLRKLNLGQTSQQSPDDDDDDRKVVGIKSVLPKLDSEVNENLMSSVKEVADSVTNMPPPIRSKLTQRLLRLSTEGKSPEASKLPIEEMLKGMKIQSKKLPESLDSQKKVLHPPRISRTKINLFDAPPLDIFKIPEETKAVSKKTVWQSLEEKKLKLLIQYAPANGFEEMIMWTEQGKHWKFPIDNQTEMGDEENVGFHEHVFLEQHLHGFPTKGPIRHFMELVCVGLSKNPYITVERKIENVNWFRDYFKDKEDILKASGAIV